MTESEARGAETRSEAREAARDPHSGASAFVKRPSFDGTFSRATLPGGVRVFLAPSTKFKTTTVKLFVRTDLDAATATSTALVPYVVRHGTPSLPSLRAVTTHLEALYGTRLGVDVLKLGEQQVVAWRLDLLGDAYLPPGSDVLGQAVALLGKLLLDPVRDGAGALRAEAVATEKETLRRFIQGLVDDKSAWAGHRCVQTMCEGEPYGAFEYGEPATLAATSGASVEARRVELLRNAELDLYVVGAFDPARALDALTTALAPLVETLGRTGAAPLRGTTPHPPPRPAREVREQLPVKQARLVLGLRTAVRLAHPDYFSLLVMNGVLGGFAHSKLFKNVREKAGLCYDAGSQHERLKGLVLIACGVDASNVEKARDLCLAQVEAIAKGDVHEDELLQTRLAFADGYRQLLDAPASLVNLDYMMTLGGRSGAPAEVAKAVAAVTKDDVVAAAVGLRLDTVYALVDAGPGAPAAEDASA